MVTSILSVAEIIIPTVVVNDCRDPKDNKFLEIAISGNADCIVSGDKDLMVLHPYRGISILTPMQFLEQANK